MAEPEKETMDFKSEVYASCGDGKYRVSGVGIRCGNDASFTFTGGTLPHVGAVSVGVYEPVRQSATVSTITVFAHRDDSLSAECARKAAIALQCCVTVTVGIHVDDADGNDLRMLCSSFRQCAEKIIDKMQHQE